MQSRLLTSDLLLPLLLLLSFNAVCAAPSAETLVARQADSEDGSTSISSTEQWAKALIRRVPSASKDGNWLENLECDLSRTSMPSVDPALPPPASNLSLAHVTVGRGTQNYACNDSTTASKPQLVGAAAILFNVSCIAANFPDLLAMMPSVALNHDIPAISNDTGSGDSEDAVTRLLSGYHYFRGPTPVFDLQTATEEIGIVAVEKLNDSPAPAGSPAGPRGTGFGAVAWLKLGVKSDAPEQDWAEVYRIQTAGGKPPPTCDGQPETLEIDYAAEYWFFS